MKVGQWLLEDPRLPRRELALRLGVSVSTLKHWRTLAREGALPPLGRPALTAAVRRQACWRVGRAMVHQGFPGWRVIRKACPGISTMLVQEYVRRFKRCRAEHRRRRIERGRVSVQVLGRDIVWVQDGLHAGRTPEGKAVEAQVVKDRGSLRTVALEVGPAASGDDVIRLWEKARQERGLPLVLASDNAASYCSEAAEAYLKSQKVIHLKSLPRTPQHNGAAESRVRELKDQSGLGKGVVLEDVHEPLNRLAACAARLDAHRLRASKGYKTAIELDAVLPRGYNAGRERFYKEARRRMQEAVLGAETWRAARLAEREAVYAALESFGLVRRERGGQPYPVRSGAVFS